MPNGVERLVINTGPLISLGRAGALDIIEQLPIRFLAPQGVAQEIEAGERTGLPVVMPSWVEVLVLATPVAPVAHYLLDLGEAAVIQLALEQDVATVCIIVKSAGQKRSVAQHFPIRYVWPVGLRKLSPTYLTLNFERPTLRGQSCAQAPR